MSDQENYIPKAGDYVRVVREGRVDNVKPYEDEWLTVSVDGLHYTSGPRYGHRFIKIAEPDPEWADGDVIDAAPFIVAFRIGGKWLTADGGVHYFSRGGEDVLTEWWALGKVKVLRKADPE